VQKEEVLGDETFSIGVMAGATDSRYTLPDDCCASRKREGVNVGATLIVFDGI